MRQCEVRPSRAMHLPSVGYCAFTEHSLDFMSEGSIVVAIQGLLPETGCALAVTIYGSVNALHER